MYEALWFAAGFISVPILAAIFGVIFRRWLEQDLDERRPKAPATASGEQDQPAAQASEPARRRAAIR